MNARRTRLPLAAVLLTLGGLLLAPTGAPALPQAAAAQVPHRDTHQVTVALRTVPAVPGVRMEFGGRVMTTDAAGRASYTAPHTLAAQTLRLLDTAVDTPGHRYRFARWSGQRDPDQAFRPVVHGLPLRADYTLTAAFTVAYPVTARFTDQHGTPLDAGHVSKATVKSSTGQLTNLHVHGTTWLDGAIPVYRSSRLEVAPVAYSLQSLIYDGAQLADAGRQRFIPATRSKITFTGPFHDLTITAHDAVFGGRTGRQADVTGPDGKVHFVRLGADDTAVLTHLPRGLYKVKVKAPGGLVAVQVFQLSRSRTVDAPVISRLDMLVVGLPLLAVGGAVLLVRRRRKGRTGPDPLPPSPEPLPREHLSPREGPS